MFNAHEYLFVYVPYLETLATASEGIGLTLHVHHPFLYITFPSMHDHSMKVSISCFVEGVNTRQ